MSYEFFRNDIISNLNEILYTDATTTIQNGAPIQHVQKLLGHSKLETTMIYVNDIQDDIKRTHERCAI